MPILPTFIPAPRRVRRKRRKLTSVPPEPVPGIVVTGVLEVAVIGPSLEVRVEVDTTAEFPLLGVDPPNPGKWQANYGDKFYTGELIQFDSYNQIVVTLTEIAAYPSPSVLNYAANPSDISDTRGRMLGAFEMSL